MNALTKTDANIPKARLELVKGGIFFYPCALYDTIQVLAVFSSFVDTFIFCDLNYPVGMKLRTPFGPRTGFKLDKTILMGDPNSELRELNGHKEIEPSTLSELYKDETIDQHLTIKRRRGFAQYGLLEMPPKSISVFMHRGDSPGESGSNVYFLEDCNSDHEPCSHLLTKLTERLKDHAIVLSDGSNTRIRQLKKFQNQNISGAEAYSKLKDRPFTRNGFTWSCIGYLDNKYGPTLAWGLTRISL